ncbi:MAG: HAD-IIB family hydrolase [Gammaproteobacteria bacterium]|nr:HAD-IIB family hydrolase [Gammaproteobacteria bacterium]
MTRDRGLYIVLISIHGLIRGHEMELGRDADTGGQVLYVVELLRALAEHPAVARVDLLTRRVVDPRVHADYGEPEEEIAPGARIIRLPCGPRRYLRKEALWPHLDSFADQALKHVRGVGRVPDIVHAHYADSGYVGVRLCSLLEVPLAFTGHSLGHVKRMRLLEKGVSSKVMESQYHIAQRIEAENMTLDNAAFVVASTEQEVEDQYGLYDHQPRRAVVIPPGIDLQRFHPPRRSAARPPIHSALRRFLTDPDKPMILALARPDPRKNLAALVHAYASRPELRERANLVLILGNREEVGTMEKGPRRVFTELMQLIDRYDLYGHVAYPKHHHPDEVPDLYRLAARSRGLFVNPALTEPFGLTLLEAAASGLPIVATRDGGPRDIVRYCRNGLLIDPLDMDALAAALHEALNDRQRWQRWARAGLAGVQRHFSWTGHVRTYLREVQRVTSSHVRRQSGVAVTRSRLPTADRMLVCDIDNTLVGDAPGLARLLDAMKRAPCQIGFGVATGRTLQSALALLREWRVPMPDFIISAAGTEIHYGPRLVEDESWKRHVDYRWDRDRASAAMRGFRGLRQQSVDEQRRFKLSYYIDPDRAPPLRDIARHLRRSDVHVNAVVSYDAFLDLLPVRASKGAALRWVADKWGIPIDRVLAAGDSGNDEEMLTGETMGVVVGNYSPELEGLRGRERIHFARASHARGILEGIAHYGFFDRVYATDSGAGVVPTPADSSRDSSGERHASESGRVPAG